MARLNTVDPETATGKAKELFDGPLKSMKINIFKDMANSPATIEFYLKAGEALGGGVLTAAEREIVSLAVSQENACDYCLAAHTVIGKGAGLSEDQTVGARRGAIEGDARLDALAKFSKNMHEKKGFVSDEDLSTFRAAGFGDAEITEVIATYALITFTNYFNHVNGTSVDFPAPPSI